MLIIVALKQNIEPGMQRFLMSIVGLLVSVAGFSQDPHFSQFYANPLYHNPAFTGTGQGGGPRVILNYRNQWASIRPGYVTYSASFDQYFHPIGGGLGLQLLYDKAGDADVTFAQASLNYSYFLPLNRDMGLLMGVKASVFQRSIDYSKLVFGDQIHPVYGVIYETQENLPCRCVDNSGIRPDFDAGLLLYSDKYYVGLSVSHITQPPFSFLGNPNSVLPRRFTLNGGGIISLDRAKVPQRYISPNLVVHMQDKFLQVLAGLYYVQNFFTVGAWYRQTNPNGDAIIFQIGVKKNPVSVGYSYDVTMSDARLAVHGAHEASIIIDLPRKARVPKKKGWRDIPCPSL